LDRERFTPGELAVILSHYDLGIIGSAREFPRGSRRSPKLLLRCERGRFLLKRRAPGRDDEQRVLFSHALLRHLHERQFPVPRLVATRSRQETLLVHGGHTYELFEFASGDRYGGSLEETLSAGKMLARFHRAVQDFQTAWHPPAASFHDSDLVRSGLNAIPTTTASHDSVSGHEAELLGMTQELYERYDDAAQRVCALGFAQWPPWIVHADWHPGNMLFDQGRVRVVLDFDSARVQPRAIDVANAMLQFSILRGESSPEQWPEYFDEARMRRLLTGYASKFPLEPEQRCAIPALMIESMIAECAMPIAATGSLGQLPGFGVLQMVRRKVRWFDQNAGRMASWIME
jgi:Ser/Thr protein kinase RdoA (MazF antagonist)